MLYASWEGFAESVAEVWNRMAIDPTAQTHALLGGILIALGTLAVKGRKPQKGSIRIDVPEGVDVSLHVGGKKVNT